MSNSYRLIFSAALFIVAVLFCQSCNIDQKKKVDANQSNFSTTDDSELFFRNLRQVYYDKIEMQEAKLNQFRFKNRVNSTESPIIDLCIVENWRYDEAYILIEPNGFLEEEDTLLIQWKDSVASTSGQLTYTRGNKEKQFKFAAEIYSSLQENHLLHIKAGTEWYPFLANYDEKEAFRVTMVDYFRLVNATR